MILIEPAMEKQFGRGALRKRAIGNFLTRAMEAAELEGEVSVLLTGDVEIRRLNREFRHKNKATDVLSFPAARVNGHIELAGDLAISVETAAREAEQRGHALDIELKVLLLHGVLHLAGWDHETDSGEMSSKEEALRAELGLAEGLISRAQISEHRAQGTGNRTQGIAHRPQRAKDGAPGIPPKSRRGKKR
jgi:probable rRNA maturation factor